MLGELWSEVRIILEVEVSGRSRKCMEMTKVRKIL